MSDAITWNVPPRTNFPVLGGYVNGVLLFQIHQAPLQVGGWEVVTYLHPLNDSGRVVARAPGGYGGQNNPGLKGAAERFLLAYANKLIELTAS